MARVPGPVARSRQRDLHGHEHVDKQRLVAVGMIGTGLLRVALWLAITVAYVAGSHTVHAWFASVSFVALLSILALLLTDWGQVAASLAQLTAGDAHADAEHNRRALEKDSVELDDIERDIARLAELQPGPDAQSLASSIRDRLQ